MVCPGPSAHACLPSGVGGRRAVCWVLSLACSLGSRGSLGPPWAWLLARREREMGSWWALVSTQAEVAGPDPPGESWAGTGWARGEPRGWFLGAWGESSQGHCLQVACVPQLVLSLEKPASVFLAVFWAPHWASDAGSPHRRLPAWSPSRCLTLWFPPPRASWRVCERLRLDSEVPFLLPRGVSGVRCQ